MPVSVSAILKTSYEAMDAHYDALAASLAKFRAATNPGAQSLCFETIDGT